MSQLNHAGVRVEVPGGWETQATGGNSQQLSSGRRETTLIHIGSFPLPAEQATFGATAVELMGSNDVLMILFEYGPESLGTPVFASQGIPRPLDPQLFDRNALQRGVAGQSGLQQFFTEKGRPFCLYVVLGSHIDRVELVAKVNEVLNTLVIT
jgi:hypothetical protein